MTDESGTWHYGLIARWWAETNTANPDEVAYYRSAIERSGQPALDLACGTGRILIPLLAAGLDIDGVDISADMLARAEDRAGREGLEPRLSRQAMHELDQPRGYGTIYICDSFGIGGRRDRDREALGRIHAHLNPGGVLVFSHDVPYGGEDERGWSRWLAGRRTDLPRAWPDAGERRVATEGDEIELMTRLGALDPLGQVARLDIRARLWNDGAVVAQEERSLLACLYFAQEVILMLEEAGFGEISMEGRYTGEPATGDDGTIVFVARRT